LNHVFWKDAESRERLLLSKTKMGNPNQGQKIKESFAHNNVETWLICYFQHRLIIPRLPFCRARFWAVVFSRKAATENRIRRQNVIKSRQGRPDCLSIFKRASGAFQRRPSNAITKPARFSADNLPGCFTFRAWPDRL